MMKEKHWLDMEVTSFINRSMTDNMMKEKHWLDMEVMSYINQVGDR
jgi:DNA helicase TIP49 (TBP-interacting protein)